MCKKQKVSCRKHPPAFTSHPEGEHPVNWLLGWLLDLDLHTALEGIWVFLFFSDQPMLFRPNGQGFWEAKGGPIPKCVSMIFTGSPFGLGFTRGSKRKPNSLGLVLWDQPTFHLVTGLTGPPGAQPPSSQRLPLAGTHLASVSFEGGKLCLFGRKTQGKPPTLQPMSKTHRFIRQCASRGHNSFHGGGECRACLKQCLDRCCT